MDLSIVLLNYKTRGFLRQYLKGLADLDFGINYEVIVVDNDSKDGSVELVQEEFLDNPKYDKLNIKLIAADKNYGHSKGNNLGIKEARGRYVMISNTDIIYLNAGDISKMINYMDAHPEIAILGPKLKNADGSIQDNCLRFYKFFTVAYRRTPLGKIVFGRKDLERFSMSDFDHQSIIEVDWIMGAQMLIRKSTLDKTGALDERFFLYFSDTDLCKRAWQNNEKVVYFPDVDIIHYHKRESAKSLNLKDVIGYVTRIHIKDWLKYIKKHGIKNSSKRTNQ